MTLAAWQTSVAELVVANAAEMQSPPLPELSEAERLENLRPTAGFGMTCEVQRWRREFRVQIAAPLTLSVLDAGHTRAGRSAGKRSRLGCC
jgi:hypothetical protein